MFDELDDYIEDDFDDGGFEDDDDADWFDGLGEELDNFGAR